MGAKVTHIRHKPNPVTSTQHNGGGRNRTDDLLLAKQALYQLSYAPVQPGLRRDPWAREDLNLRPHAYQACALTN